jgi:hypothetical protein
MKSHVFPPQKGQKSSSARVHPPFHKPMILFDHIIQVLALPQQTGFWKGAVALEGLEGRRIRRVLGSAVN